MAAQSLRLNTAGCIVLPSALFIGLMISTAGTAIYPPLTAVANPLICSGEVAYKSRSYSYRPGQSGVQRFIYCQSGGPKGSRVEITWTAIGVSFLIYSAAFFLLLQFVARPLLRRRSRDTLEAARARFSPASSSPAGPAAVQNILARVAEAMQRGEANVVVNEAGGGDLAGRLARLKELRDQGLITAEDYEAKKAELLSRL